jgi:beta-glucosidase
MKNILFGLLLAGLTPLCAQNFPQLGKNPVHEVVAAMSLEEKIHLLVGMGMKIPGTNIVLGGGPVVGQTNDKVPGCAGTTYAIPRLGIPSIVLADGPAGLRIAPRRDSSQQTYYCTAFPVATLLASSWDTDLVRRAGEAMGNEAKEYGVDILLAPGLNIHRNALGGRNFEYYSEDPIVSGKMAAAMIQGIQSQGVGTSAKHFAVNNQETNRNLVNARLNLRALREIYLRGFEIAVKEGKPFTIMSSYNKINGTYASQSPDLLIQVLRNDWKFGGAVMTDWFGGDDPVAQMKAGNEWLMPGTTKQSDAILKAVLDGSLSEAILDRNVKYVLGIIQQTNSFKNIAKTDRPDLAQNAATARALAAEGMVLLKNNGVLPLKSGASVAVVGNGSYEFISGGTGSGDVNEAYTVSLPEGLKNAGWQLNNDLQNSYTSYIQSERAKQPKPAFFFAPKPPIAEMPLSMEKIRDAARQQAVAVLTISRNSGEFYDRQRTPDFELNEAEKQLIRNTAEAFHKAGKKLVVVLNIGGPVETASWRDQADAILLAWQPGQEAGNAVADVLSGKVNPCGKLTTSFPLKYDDEPSSRNFPGVELEKDMRMSDTGIPLGKLSEVTHEEGIYVGYRYYNTFKVKTAYEFGYGASYTSFEYADFKTSRNEQDGSVTARISVKNSGKTAGKEVVQLYLSAPEGKLPKPALELKAFGKTRLLQPGESQTLEFRVSAAEMASFDPAQSAWLLEKGTYTLKAGASSLDIRQQSRFELSSDLICGQTSKALVPEKDIQEWPGVKEPRP